MAGYAQRNDVIAITRVLVTSGGFAAFLTRVTGPSPCFLAGGSGIGGNVKKLAAFRVPSTAEINASVSPDDGLTAPATPTGNRPELQRFG